MNATTKTMPSSGFAGVRSTRAARNFDPARGLVTIIKHLRSDGRRRPSSGSGTVCSWLSECGVCEMRMWNSFVMWKLNGGKNFVVVLFSFITFLLYFDDKSKSLGSLPPPLLNLFNYENCVEIHHVTVIVTRHFLK